MQKVYECSLHGHTGEVYFDQERGAFRVTVDGEFVAWNQDQLEAEKRADLRCVALFYGPEFCDWEDNENGPF
jgi:hypothetical protein